MPLVTSSATSFGLAAWGMCGRKKREAALSFGGRLQGKWLIDKVLFGSNVGKRGKKK